MIPLESTASAATGRWPEILTSLGIDPKFLVKENGPCPGCGGKDRFEFTDELNGKWFCRQATTKGCSKPDGFTLLQHVHGWDFKKAAEEVDRVLGRTAKGTNGKPKPHKPEPTHEENVEACTSMIRACGNVESGTPAYAYLSSRCGEGPFPSTLKAHPGLRHPDSGGIHPALIAILQFKDGMGASAQRTFLTRDGRKADVKPVRKPMYGLPLVGASVRLGKAAEVMGVAEGIETAICAGRMFNMPVWSALCTSGMMGWEWPDECKHIVIFADNDENEAGIKAAFHLAMRLWLAGITYEVRMPEAVGTDWADVYASQRNQVAA